MRRLLLCSCSGLCLFVAAAGCPEEGPTCIVIVNKISAEDPSTHTITVDGSFSAGQPILVLQDANGMKTPIPGDLSNDGKHATFTVSGLAPGTYKVSFDASCNAGSSEKIQDNSASPTVQIL